MTLDEMGMLDSNGQLEIFSRQPRNLLSRPPKSQALR